MLFNSLEFLIFLPEVFIFYWYVVNRKLWSRNLFLLIASYIFYGWWDWRFLSLLRRELDYVIPIEYPALYSLEDNYFLDGFHPGEVFVGIQLQEHARKSQVLQDLVNPNLKKVNGQALIPLTYKR